MIVAGPGVPSGVRLAGRARTADLLPTLLAAAGIPAPGGLDGVDVIGGPRTRESYAETVYPRTLGWAPLHSLRVGTLKYIDAPRPELYDLAHDPGEQHDLAARRPDDVGAAVRRPRRHAQRGAARLPARRPTRRSPSGCARLDT